MDKHFDAVVVGAGQAGPFLTGRLCDAGQTVALIERDKLGGTCVNVGCTPTKAMVANARAVHQARRGAEFGFTIGAQPTVEMKQVRTRKDAIVNDSREGLESWLGSMKGCSVIRGAATFASPSSVRVGEDTYHAEKIFLNVGARPSVPPLPGVDSVPFLTSSTILDLDEIPEHLVIVGGSYVGLEFAQIFRRFGAEVTVVERGSRLIAHEDEDVSLAVQDILRKDGITLRLSSECIRLEQRDGKAVVHVSCTDGIPEVHASHILLAVGRSPNTDTLGLDLAALKLDAHGFIPVDDQLRTSVPGIWAMGDCNGRGAFTHTSYNDFEIVAANLLDNDPRKVSDRIPVHALYIDPPLAQVGMTETEVRRRGLPALIGTRPMSKVGRAVEKGETQGFMKVLVDKASGLILGASILGTGGDEAIHCILTAMYAGKPASLLQRSMHIHPTVAELIPTVMGDLKPLT